MYYLLLAIFSSALISLIMRLSTQKTAGGLGMLAMNYLMCLLLSACYTGPGNLLPQSPQLPLTIALGALSGVLYLLGFVLLQVNVRANGVILPATFMKLGLLVPMLVSIVLFGEQPTAAQLAGFLIALCAIIIIHSEKRDAQTRNRFGLILLLLAGGSADAMSKVYEGYGSPDLSAQFLFYTFFFAFSLCLVCTICSRAPLGKAEILFGLAIGIPNFFSARFLLRALEALPAVIVYPTYSVATLLLVTVSGVIVFRERLKGRQWAALGAILAVLVLLNL